MTWFLWNVFESLFLHTRREQLLLLKLTNCKLITLGKRLNNLSHKYGSSRNENWNPSRFLVNWSIDRNILGYSTEGNRTQTKVKIFNKKSHSIKNIGEPGISRQFLGRLYNFELLATILTSWCLILKEDVGTSSFDFVRVKLSDKYLCMTDSLPDPVLLRSVFKCCNRKNIQTVGSIISKLSPLATFGGPGVPISPERAIGVLVLKIIFQSA